jgi:ADP-heptose:LPS heptosyltransferase
MRIAVWNTAFLGDAVLTLPLVHALRRAWPQAGIDLYVRYGLRSLFKEQTCISNVYEITRKDRTARGMLRLLRTVGARRYDVWISAHLSPRSSLVALSSGAPMRIGYAHAWHRNAVYTHTVDRAFDTQDEIERLLALLRPLEDMARDQLEQNRPLGWSEASWPPAWPDIWPEVECDLRILHSVKAARQELPPGPVLGMHPGSVWGTKRWTPQGFARIARKAVDAGAVLVMFAGSGESGMAAEVLELAGLEQHPRVLDLSERLSLPQLAAWLQQLDCYLTNDSGPMHLAWMQKVPVVAVFGPTVRELGFFPRGDSQVVETPLPLPCRPCGLHGPQECPRGDHACMAGIDPETVWKAVSSRLFG